MRFSMRRAIQWLLVIALVQVAVYYWSVKSPRRVARKVDQHTYLQSAVKLEGTCSFRTCPPVKKGMINVHLIAHSHIDVGWLKTVNQYYTGEDVTDSRITGCVRCTINTTIAELLKNPTRRFIFIEMKYLSRYWNEADEDERKLIRRLIKERRLEIVNGGWVMSDAGTTMYNDIIDQHTLGFDFIRDTFGPCAQSRTGWHVDQFGHSREHASIFAQMAYDSLFIGRIDFQDLDERKRTKNMEFIWQASPHNLKNMSTIFVQATFDGYYAPPSYVFDTASDNPKDAIAMQRYASDFIKVLEQRAQAFRTNHLLVPMGSDFGYKEASKWYNNMDALIQEINSKTDFRGTPLNLLYSTPSCYTYYVNKASEVYLTKTDDFHPYGIAPGVYWTGYFTTRGGFKMHIRKAGQILQSCKQLSIFSGLDSAYNKINSLRDAMAVMQHHDAITGTQTKHVLQDYNMLLSRAVEQCEAIMSLAYQKIWDLERDNSDNENLNGRFCHDLNISSCLISENNKEFVMTIYNPLSWPVNLPVRLPVKTGRLAITNENENQLPVQVVPVPDGIKNIPERHSNANMEVVFIAQLPAMSVSSYKVRAVPDAETLAVMERSVVDIEIQNEHLLLTFSGKTGKLLSIYNKDIKQTVSLTQEYAFYVGHQGTPRPSGTYVFVPQNPVPTIVAPDKVETRVFKGEIVQEVHQKFNTWVSQVVRLYKGARYAEFQWIVGPLDDNMGREVISRFTSGLNSTEIFYTDSNGREVLQRTRAKPGNAKTKIKDFVSGNYYPVTSRIFIRDEQKKIQFTIIPDRAQGGSSLSSGSVELMVHRRLMQDDGLGVSEPLKDDGADKRGIIYTGKHFVCLDTIANSARLVKQLSLATHFTPVMMFFPWNNDSNFDSTIKDHVFLSTALPDNIQVLTLDRISESITSMYLLRLEHVFEVDEHPDLSQPAEVSLQNLFQPFDIVTAEETTLGGNFRPHEIRRMKWNTVEEFIPSSSAFPDYNKLMEPPFTIMLQPMEIRTFRVQVARML